MKKETTFLPTKVTPPAFRHKQEGYKQQQGLETPSMSGSTHRSQVINYHSFPADQDSQLPSTIVLTTLSFIIMLPPSLLILLERQLLRIITQKQIRNEEENININQNNLTRPAQNPDFHKMGFVWGIVSLKGSWWKGWGINGSVGP